MLYPQQRRTPLWGAARYYILCFQIFHKYDPFCHSFVISSSLKQAIAISSAKRVRCQDVTLFRANSFDEPPAAEERKLIQNNTLQELQHDNGFSTSRSNISFLDADDDEIVSICEENPLSSLGQTFKWLPLTSLLAYQTFPETQRGFKEFLDLLALNKNWHDVDGGHYRLDLLLPPTNSIVLPMVSLLFAILAGQTITSFRTRMLCVDAALNKETKNLEVLASLIGSVGRQRNDQSHSSQDSNRGARIASEFVLNSNRRLIKYISRIVNECINYKDHPISASSTDCEMNAMLEATIKLSDQTYTTEVTVNPSILSEIFSIISKLNADRTDRISALNATFPLAHYIILCLLASVIMGAFLMETDVTPNLFLNDVQLRLLWSVLVGTFALIAKVINDLESPFVGDYKITSWSEFLVFRERLKVTLKRNSAH